MLLKELFGENLQGWTLEYGYILELSTIYKQCHPAIISETRKIVACLDRGDLEKIWSVLPKRAVQTRKILFIVNRGSKIVININSPKNGDSDSESFGLILSDEIEALLEIPEYFEWVSGPACLRSEEEATFPKE